MTRVFRRLHLFRFLVFVMGFERPLPRCHGPRTTVKSCTRAQFPAGPPPSMSSSTFSPTLLMAGVALLRNRQDHEELQGAGRVDVHGATAIRQNLLIELWLHSTLLAKCPIALYKCPAVATEPRRLSVGRTHQVVQFLRPGLCM
jgi:hypothetical protein